MGDDFVEKNEHIKCDVESCVHNDCEENYCCLDEIKVSCNCPKDDAKEKKETVCESFECKEDCDCDTQEDDSEKEE